MCQVLPSFLLARTSIRQNIALLFDTLLQPPLSCDRTQETCGAGLPTVLISL